MRSSVKIRVVMFLRILRRRCVYILCCSQRHFLSRLFGFYGTIFKQEHAYTLYIIIYEIRENTFLYGRVCGTKKQIATKKQCTCITRRSAVYDLYIFVCIMYARKHLDGKSFMWKR